MMEKKKVKNIILQDWDLAYLETILSFDDVFISVLVVDMNARRFRRMAEKHKDRIGRVYFKCPDSYETFFKMNECNHSLTLKEIEDYKPSQLKADYDFHRTSQDHSESQYRYFTALNFWIDVFENTKIDCVLGTFLEHGTTYDSLCYDVAKKNGVPVYLHEPEVGSSKGLMCYFRRINDNKLINLSQFKGLPKVNLNDFIHNKKTSMTKPYKKITLKEKYSRSLFKKFLDLILHHIKLGVRTRKQRFLYETETYMNPYRVDFRETFFNSIHIKEMQKVYNAISEKPKENESYVFFALHYEPEATILNRGALNNQLYAIKVLSEVLPQGWKIYVKEHPHSFYFPFEWDYFFHGLDYFKTKQFYRNIMNLKNTKLIKLDVSSKELIANSKAVASLCGTVLLEAIDIKKPTLIFSPENTITSNVKDVFNVTRGADLNGYLDEIKNGYVPEYSNLSEIISEYTVLNYRRPQCAENIDENFKQIFRYLIYETGTQKNLSTNARI